MDANHRNTQRTLVKIDLRFNYKVLRGIFCFVFLLYFKFSYLLHHLKWFLPYMLSSLGEMESGRLVLCGQNGQDIFPRTSLVRFY